MCEITKGYRHLDFYWPTRVWKRREDTVPSHCQTLKKQCWKGSEILGKHLWHMACKKFLEIRFSRFSSGEICSTEAPSSSRKHNKQTASWYYDARCRTRFCQKIQNSNLSNWCVPWLSKTPINISQSTQVDSSLQCLVKINQKKIMGVDWASKVQIFKPPHPPVQRYHWCISHLADRSSRWTSDSSRGPRTYIIDQKE